MDEILLDSYLDTETGCYFIALKDNGKYVVKYVCPGMRDFLKYRKMHEGNNSSSQNAHRQHCR